MKQRKYFIIDFDSTFTKVEAFDVLASISLRDHPEQKARTAQVVEITNQGMSGGLSFRESLEKRLALIAPERKHLPLLIEELKKQGANDIIVFVGGVIPRQDYDFLYEAGVKGIYGPGTPIPASAKDVLEQIKSSLK